MNGYVGLCVHVMVVFVDEFLLKELDFFLFELILLNFTWFLCQFSFFELIFQRMDFHMSRLNEGIQLLFPRCQVLDFVTVPFQLVPLPTQPTI